MRSVPRSDTKAEELKDVGPAVWAPEDDGSGSKGAELSPMATYDVILYQMGAYFVGKDENSPLEPLK
jgi:hypothetical protein